MRSRDASLVFLTVLSQGSIGIVLCLTGLAYFSDHATAPVGAGFSDWPALLLALILVVVATAASFLHLGNPANAPRALSNLSGSWLSREILAIGAYSLLLAAALVAGWAGAESGISRLLLIPAALAGLFLLWSMSCVYLVPTIPPWNHWYTPVSFMTTTLCLGSIGAMLLMNPGQPELKVFMGILVTALAVELLTGILNQQRLVRMEPGFDMPTFSHGTYYMWFTARLAILAVAYVATLFVLLQPDISLAEHVHWMYPVFVMVIIQEFAGRRMFYASYFRAGI